MAKGENPQDYFRNIGSDIIDNNIGWKARTAYQLATGAIGVEQALANTDYSISDLSARWNVSEQSVRNFLMFLLGSQDLISASVTLCQN